MDTIMIVAIAAGILLFGGSLMAFFKKLISPKNFMTIAVIGVVLAALGVFGSDFQLVNLGSPAVEETYIADIQVTTAFASNCTTALDNSDLRVQHVRCTDAQSTEDAGTDELKTGIITVTRAGDVSKGLSCPVTVNTPSFKDEEDSSDVNTYYILERDAAGRLAVYLQNGAAATTSSPRASTYIQFAENDYDATLGIVMEADEEAMDNLAQYSSKPVYVDVCGEIFTVNIQSLY